MTNDDELDREIRDHLELEAEERRAPGTAAEEAMFVARRRFGNVGLVKEAVRATRRFAHLDTARQDLRYAVRGLLRSPAFTLTAVLSLTLGIGANTAVFTLIHALLLRALPVADPGRLVQISMVRDGRAHPNFSYPAVRALAQQPHGLLALCGFSPEPFALGQPGSGRTVTGAWMTGDCHRALGVGLTAGRGFTPDDDRPEGAANGLVAVISDDFWTRELGRSPDAIGKPILIDGKKVTVIGVTAPGFTGANVGRTADVTLPVSAMLTLRPDGPPIMRKDANWLRLFARLERDEPLDQATARLNLVWPRLIDVLVEPAEREVMRTSRLVVSPGATGWSELRERFTGPLFVLMTIVVLVLLIACANLASLLLARAAVRRREFAIRLAMGAGRFRLMRQVFTEGLLLAAIGGAAAIAFAQGCSRVLVTLLSSGRSEPITLDVRPDAAVLAFSLAVALGTSVFFGVTPAIRATAIDESAALHDSMRSRAGRRGLLAASLVALQAALSLVLVVGAGLFARTLSNLVHAELGFRRDGVTLVYVETSRAIRDATRETTLAQDILDNLRRLPGVRAGSVSGSAPLSGGWTMSVTRDGASTEAEAVTASPSYFDVFGIARRAGRDFSLADGPGSQPVVIVNEALARERFAGTNPIGQLVRVGGRPDGYEVVGVVGDVASEGPRNKPHLTIYLSFFQGPNPQLSGGGVIALRTEGAPITPAAIRERVRAKSPLAGVRSRPLSDLIDSTLVNERLLALLTVFFGGLALALAAIGLYGLLAFSVSRRTTEIGVRTALGATRPRVLWLVMSDALRLVGAGVVLGVPAIWASTRLVARMLFGVTATDPTTIVLAVGLIVLTALLAAYLPAWRAMSIDPITALKYE